MSKTERLHRPKFRPLPDGTHREAGRHDRAGRWYPHDSFRVPGSFDVRSPSRAWPNGYLRHFYTRRYAEALFWAQPLVYLQLQQIPRESDEGQRLIAAYAARRLGAGAGA